MKKLLAIVVLGLLWCNVGFAKELKISEDLKKLIEGSIELIEEEKNKGKTKKIQSIFGLTFDLPYHYKPATVLSENQVMEGAELLALKKDINDNFKNLLENTITNLPQIWEGKMEMYKSKSKNYTETETIGLKYIQSAESYKKMGLTKEDVLWTCSDEYSLLMVKTKIKYYECKFINFPPGSETFYTYKDNILDTTQGLPSNSRRRTLKAVFELNQSIYVLFGSCKFNCFNILKDYMNVLKSAKIIEQ